MRLMEVINNFTATVYKRDTAEDTMVLRTNVASIFEDKEKLVEWKVDFHI